MVESVKKLLLALLCISVIALSGCGGSVNETDKDMQPQGKAMGAGEPLDSIALGISEGRTTEGMLPIYFNFDSSDIRSDQVPQLEGNADFIKNHPEYEIRIEGNCDPRGTNEYNMALGERRALIGKKYLINLGVNEARLTTISYGEERMLLYGHDELSWAQNRRADFVIID